MIKKYFQLLVHNNDEFNDYLNATLNKDKISVSKKSAYVGTFLITIFGITDIISANENLEIILGIRLLMTISCLMAIYLINYHRTLFLNYYYLIASSVYLTASFGILGMIYISASAGIVHSTYFAGLMLVIFALFSLVYINTSISLTISLIIILCYIITYALKENQTNYTFTLLLNNLMFLLSAIIFGLLADIIRKKYLFKHYISQKRLGYFLLTNHNNEALSLDKVKFLSRMKFQQSINDCIFDANTAHLNLILSTIKIDEIGNKRIPDDKLVNNTLNALYQQSNAQLKAYRNNNVIWCLCFTKDTNDAFKQTLNTNIKTHLQQYKNNIHVKTSILELSKENEFEDQKILSLSALSDVELNNRPSNVVLVKS